jgi:hypothetical protein
MWAGNPKLVLVGSSATQTQQTAEFIRENFIPVKAHIEEHPAWFHCFDAVWTPTVLLLDAGAKSVCDLRGLPNKDFIAALMSDLSRMAFV